MMLASFEWLQATTKVEIGRQLLARFRKQRPGGRELWAVGRLGNRTAIYGSLDRLIPGEEAETWISTLLELDMPPTENLAYCLVLLAQLTGDRARDIADELRGQVGQWLHSLPEAARLQELLTNPDHSLQRSEQSWMLGEALPAGLVLFAPEVNA